MLPLSSLQVLLLNNQHLGMVVQWEDRFYKVGVLDRVLRGLLDRVLRGLGLGFSGSHHPNGAAAVLLPCGPAVQPC